MAKDNKPAKTAIAPARTGRSVSTGIVLAGLLPAVLVMLPTCVVLAAGMVPTAVAWCVDRSARKHLTVSVGALNLCGSLVFVIELWTRGHYLPFAFAVLGDLFGWLAALGAAAVGWTIYLTMPTLIVNIATLKERARLAELDKLQRALIAEWGEAVASKS